MVNPITNNSDTVSSDPTKLSDAAEVLLTALLSLKNVARGDRGAILAGVKEALPPEHATRQELESMLNRIDDDCKQTTVTFGRKWCG